MVYRYSVPTGQLVFSSRPVVRTGYSIRPPTGKCQWARGRIFCTPSSPDAIFTHAPWPCNISRNLPTVLHNSCSSTSLYSSSVWDPHTKTLVNKIEMVQRRAARFCHNDYKTIEKGCMSEMIGKLNLEPLNIRRTKCHNQTTHNVPQSH